MLRICGITSWVAHEQGFIAKDHHFFSLINNLIKGISLSSFTKGGSDAKCTNIITRILCCLLYLFFHWCYGLLLHIRCKLEKNHVSSILLFSFNLQINYSSDKCASKCIYLLKIWFCFCWAKVDFAPSLMARIVLERFLQEKEQAIRKYFSCFGFFSFVFFYS